MRATLLACILFFNDGPDPLCAIYCCNIEATDTSYVRYEIADVPLIMPENRNERPLNQNPLPLALAD